MSGGEQESRRQPAVEELVLCEATARGASLAAAGGGGVALEHSAAGPPARCHI